jgi:4-hydroxy-3-polyprenylbenzoate decarboxylase
MKLIVGITGASGAICGIKLLEVLNKQPQIETHLVLSDPAKQTIELETNWTVAKVEALASFVHDSNNIGASISSGSFRTDGMIVGIKTMSSIAISYNNNLIVRAADVTLKEKKRLVLAVRETPLHLGHLRKMVELAEIGAVILPPMPAFYHHPKTIDDIIEQTVGKILDQFDITHNLFKRWQGVDDTIGSETEAGRF